MDDLRSPILRAQLFRHAKNLNRKGLQVSLLGLAPTKDTFAAGRSLLPALAEELGLDIYWQQGARPGLPGSEGRNGRKLDAFLETLPLSPDFIHARADYAAAVLAASTYRGTTVWDCRGDQAEESRQMHGNPVVAAAAFKTWQRRADHAARCTRANFVSRALAEHHSSRFSGKAHEVIPSTADENTFFFDPALRRQAREELGIPGDAGLMIYSGSMSAYQGVASLVNLLPPLLEDPTVHLLVLTRQAEEARRRFAPLQAGARLQVLSAAPDQVNRYLCAADLGLMLREDNPINRVASPVKMGEYALCGLPVLATAAVEQVWDWAGRCGLAVSLEQFREAGFKGVPGPGERPELAAAGLSRWGWEAHWPAWQRLYGLAP